MEKNKPTNNFDFDIRLIADFFKELDRQGPGSDEQTIRALSFVRDFLPDDRPARIADIGCGTGRQTVVLTKALECRITAVDLLPQMVEGLRSRLLHTSLQQRVTPMQGDMNALPFAPESLDVIWAEGSIYNMGFGAGLAAWRKLLIPGGFVAASDCCYLSERRPENTKWLTDNFVEIDSIPHKIAIMQQAGYEPTAHFILPPDCWTENYYGPMAAHIERFAAENGDNPSAQLFLAQLTAEMDYYRQLGDYYGYVFFIGRKC